jgi:hypothetical protein
LLIHIGQKPLTISSTGVKGQTQLSLQVDAVSPRECLHSEPPRMFDGRPQSPMKVSFHAKTQGARLLPGQCSKWEVGDQAEGGLSQFLQDVTLGS